MKNQTFCAVHEVSDDFNDEDMNGIMGLAFGTISVVRELTFFEKLLAWKELTESIFAVYLTRGQPDGSEVSSLYDDMLAGTHLRQLCLGCYDITKATGPVFWNTVVSRVSIEPLTSWLFTDATAPQTYWSVPMDGVSINESQTVPTDCTAVNGDFIRANQRGD